MPVPARFGNLRHTALSAFWFGNFFMWQPLTTIVIQNQIDAVVPKANQGTAIGLAVSVVGVFAVGIPPLVRAISDRLTTPIGRRPPGGGWGNPPTPPRRREQANRGKQSARNPGLR